jgi:hypothetical protein
VIIESTAEIVDQMWIVVEYYVYQVLVAVHVGFELVVEREEEFFVPRIVV